MKRLSLTALVAILTGASAHAADLSPNIYTKAPGVAAVNSWTGFYLGAELGGRSSNSTWTSTGLEDPVVPFENTLRLLQGNPAGFSASTARVGGYAGYNWQFAPTWVVGIEGDLAWGDSRRTLPGIPGTWSPSYPATTIALDSSTLREGWDGGIRGRLGFLITPNAMLFGTGGIAWQNVSLAASCSIDGPWCILNRSESFDKAMTGWTIGGGIETKIASNWLVRFEYRYADFGTVSHEFFPSTVDAVFMTQSLKTQSLSVGVAYQFGAPATAGY